MNVVQNVLLGLINFYSLAIIVYVIMSWIPDNGQGVIHDLRQVLATICDPYLNVFKKIIPVIGGIDISPIFAIIVLNVLSYAIQVYL